jgi:hypothetical protein
MYRLCMNRYSSHANHGALGHNFNEMSFRIDWAGAFAKASTDKPKLLRNESSSPEGCDDA